jgi:acid phosphatase (class A)
MKLVSLMLLLNLFNTAFAQSDFLDNGSVIGPYPVSGSVEAKDEIEEMLYLQEHRSQEECDAAEFQATANLETLFGGKDGSLTDSEIKKVKKKLRLVTIKSGVEIYFTKREFKRPRPYLTHSEIKPCIELEKSTSYPSGHSAIARVYARLLSVIYPERAEDFQQQGDQAALNRVIGGVHHPSDTIAGKKLGDILADSYLSNSKFKKELEILGKK